MAQQLSERYIDDLDALNASLRSKYGGLDLSSSTEDIAAFAQNSERGLRLNLLFTEKVAVRQVRNFQTISLICACAAGDVHDHQSRIPDRQREAPLTKETRENVTACDLSTLLRDFYLKHNPEFVEHAAKVALMYDDDIRSFSQCCRPV